jgi:hypothetical protein
VVVRETETVLGEKVTHRTEEITDPVTGQAHLQTIEYVEKVIEKEVCVHNLFQSNFSLSFLCLSSLSALFVTQKMHIRALLSL